MALSIRAYAVHRGVSHTAVRKAIASGRIRTLADGRIDPADADRSWANVDPAKRPVETAAAAASAHAKPATRSSPSPRVTGSETPPASFSTADPSAFLRARIAGGGIVAGATVSVAYERPDPDAVDLADIVGGVDPGTGAYRGVQALLAAQSEVNVTPRILLAPGFTHQKPEGFANPVVAEMLGIAGRLRAVIVADGPNASDAAAIGYREDWGSPRVYVIDPWVKVLDASGALADQPASPRVAGLIAGSDNDRGFWWSPSNQTINGIVGTSRPIDFVLGDANARANLLNENEVATIVHQDGYRLWGNRTCSSDPKWAFLSVRRTADMINESLQQAHLWAVDRNITRTYLEDVTEGVSAYLRRLQAQGAILGGRCWPDPDLNTPESIADGQVFFDFDFTPPYPAEHITFRSHLVNDYITEILK